MIRIRIRLETKDYNMEYHVRVGRTSGQTGRICFKGRKGWRAGKAFLQCVS